MEIAVVALAIVRMFLSLLAFGVSLLVKVIGFLISLVAGLFRRLFAGGR